MGTADPGQDFTLHPGIVSFAPDQRHATIAVNIHNDAVSEGVETIIIEISGPGQETSTGAPFRMRLRINASDR